MRKKPGTPNGVCDTCKKEVASGPDAAGVADAVKRHKKKAHGFGKRKSA